MLTDPEKAALEQLEQERERRIAEKIEKGQAVRGPVVVVGVPPECYPPQGGDSEGREIYPAEPISVIITGVTRAGRDDDYQPIAEAASKSADWKCPICAGVFPASTTIHPCKPAAEGLPKSPPPRSAQPIAPTEKHQISTQIAPRSEADPGEYLEGYYTVSGGMLYVQDLEGQPLGSQALKPGDDPIAAARKILRSGCDGFYGKISYPLRAIH